MKKKSSKLCFRGCSEHALDAKGRLNIPARFRNVLRAEYSDDLIVTSWEKCLKVYPVTRWEVEEEKLYMMKEKDPSFEPLFRYVVGGVNECSLDKQGRILIPGNLRKRFNLVKDVALNGMRDHFELWDQLAWQQEFDRTQQRFPDMMAASTALG